MTHGTNILFDNTYARLPERFFARQAPAPVPAPTLVRINRELAATLSVDSDWFASADGVAMLAGSATPEGSEPIAQAYAGHQFGGFVPQLGDGRAILLGEAIDTSGARRDLQLKGSGRTPFSRGGDGRAALGPVLREYVISEAMSALGVPTTRALAAVTTGEIVMRQEGPLAGGVFTRVAASHIRVGTFQYFLVRNDIDALRLLSDHAIARHYPQAGLRGESVSRTVGVGRRGAGGSDCPVDVSGLHPWRDEHGQYDDLRGDDRLRPMCVHGRVSPAMRLQFDRSRCALCLWQAARHRTLEPHPIRRNAVAALVRGL